MVAGIRAALVFIGALSTGSLVSSSHIRGNANNNPLNTNTNKTEYTGLISGSERLSPIAPELTAGTAFNNSENSLASQASANMVDSAHRVHLGIRNNTGNSNNLEGHEPNPIIQRAHAFFSTVVSPHTNHLAPTEIQKLQALVRTLFNQECQNSEPDTLEKAETTIKALLLPDNTRGLGKLMYHAAINRMTNLANGSMSKEICKFGQSLFNNVMALHNLNGRAIFTLRGDSLTKRRTRFGDTKVTEKNVDDLAKIWAHRMKEKTTQSSRPSAEFISIYEKLFKAWFTNHQASIKNTTNTNNDITYNDITSHLDINGPITHLGGKPPSEDDVQGKPLTHEQRQQIFVHRLQQETFADAQKEFGDLEDKNERQTKSKAFIIDAMNDALQQEGYALEAKFVVGIKGGEHLVVTGKHHPKKQRHDEFR